MAPTQPSSAPATSAERLRLARGCKQGQAKAVLDVCWVRLRPRVGLLAPAGSLSGLWAGSTASMGPWFSSKVPSLLCSLGSWCPAQAGSSAGANAVAGGSRSCSGACPLAPSPARPPARSLGVVGLGSSTPEQHGSLHSPLPLRDYSPRGLLAVL